MFIKKVVKDNEVFYILTLCERVESGTGKGKNKDTHFISVFIPQKLAELMISAGVTLKEKDKEQK